MINSKTAGKGDRKRRPDPKWAKPCAWVSQYEKDHPKEDIDPDVAKAAMNKLLYPSVFKKDE